MSHVRTYTHRDYLTRLRITHFASFVYLKVDIIMIYFTLKTLAGKEAWNKRKIDEIRVSIMPADQRLRGVV